MTGLLIVAMTGTLGAAPIGPDQAPLPADSALLDSVSVANLTDAIGTADLADAVAVVATTTRRGAATVIILNSDILFAFADARLSPAARSRVGALVAGVPAGATVSITGYTDTIGSPADNRELSRRRAEAVAGAVRQRRADVVLRIAGRGEADPVAPNSVAGKDNPDGRALNRRVEIRYGSPR